MKKAFAMLLALVMVLSLATTAFADTTRVTISDQNTVQRTINGYQLMTATNAGNAYSYQVNPVYEDILIGVLGLTDADFVNAKNDVERSDIIESRIAAITSAQYIRDFADLVYRAILDTNPAITPEATLTTGSAQELDQGYWLFADVTDLDGSEFNNSLVMMDTAGADDLNFNIKPRKTTTDKKVDDENDSAFDGVNMDGEDNIDDWREAADHDVGDKVPYQISVTLPNDISSFVDKNGNGYFALKIVDTADKGLTYNEDFVLTFSGGASVPVQPAGTADALFVYTIVENADESHTLTVYPNFGYTKRNGEVCEADAVNGGDMLSLHDANGVKVRPEDLSTMSMILSYTATVNDKTTPSSTGYVNKEKVVVSNDPYSDSFGETPEEKTTVFNYKLVVDKIDAATKNPLAGADFDLEKFIPCTAGTACTETHDHYYLNHTNQLGHFITAEAKKTTNDNKPIGEAVTFNFTGLDAGAYRLRETVKPAGYNPIPDMYFLVLPTISADSTQLTDLRMHELTLNERTTGNPYIMGGPNSKVLLSAATEGTLLEASLNLDVENKTGTELPTTGGTGTTMLYIAGASLVAFAVVMLITKKRMASAE